MAGAPASAARSTLGDRVSVLDYSMDPKPVLHTLVGIYEEPLGLIGPGQIVPLTEAVEYQAFGFWVFLDPADEMALAQWERLQRRPVRSRQLW
jgi:hypothetical protein